MRVNIKDKLKKDLKIICVNLFLLMIVIGLLEIVSFGILINKCWFMFELTIKNKWSDINYFKAEKFDKKNYNKYFRKPTLKKNSKKGNIILFGCSYTMGAGLNENQTFAYKLANYTNRSVYNEGLSGQGPQIMLFQLSDHNFKKIVPNADFIIYTFISDHLSRMYMYRCWPFMNLVSMKYELVNNKLIEKDLIYPFNYSYTVRLYDVLNQEKHSKKERETLLLKIFEESYNKSKELYPSAKFIILNYPQGFYENGKVLRYEYAFSEEFKTSIKDFGIKIISPNELTNGKILDKKYQISDSDNHPNAKAWDLVVPLLAKKINL